MTAPVEKIESDPAFDAWLERALADDAAEHRAAHVDDAGFTARVMAALPAPLAAPRWRKPVEWALWGVAGTAIAASLPSAARKAPTCTAPGGCTEGGGIASPNCR